MGALKVFLDANVLFSAALGGPAFDLLWALAERGRVQLLTSPLAVVEAERNLEQKRPEATARLWRRLGSVRLVPDVNDPPDLGLPPADAALFAAAERAGADCFLTGGLRHFGAMMSDADLRPRVRTPRDFLLEEGT